MRRNCAAVEGVFFSANVKTALKLAHVRGVALLAIAEAGIELGGVLSAGSQNQRGGLWPRGKEPGADDDPLDLLRLAEPIESEDACDALAVAICHATHESTNRRLA